MATDQQMLEELIQKAIDGAWDVCGHFVDGDIDEWEVLETREGLWLSLFTDLSEVGEGHSEIARWHSHELIFNHDFAKALWGEEEFGHDNALDPKPIVEWQWNLQQMVIADNPIKYMWESIHGN